MKKNGPIVVLGGYGQAGRALVAMLKESSDNPIVIAGRRPGKAEELAHRLDESGQRLRACYADAARPETLRSAFQGASLVIVTAIVPQHVVGIAQACLDADCDYFDILETACVLDTLQEMAPSVEKAGRLFVTQGGLAPGFPPAFARLACSRLDRCRSIRIGNALSFKTMERPEQVTEVFDFALNNKPSIFREGGWQKRALGQDHVMMDFGPNYGSRPAMLLDMAELHGIPEQLGLEEMAFYGAVPTALLHFPINTILAVFNKVKGSFVWKTLARATLWASKLPNERCGYSIVLEACGHRDGKEQTVRIVLEHEDNYLSTAAAVVAFLNQYHAGAFSRLSGVKVMGHIIDPEWAIRDIEALGLHVMTTQSDSFNSP